VLKVNKLMLIIVATLVSVSILNSELSISNSEQILYNVSLSGAVRNPGVFAVPPSTRVSSVLKLSEIEYFDALKYHKDIQIPEDNLQLKQKKHEQYYPEDLDIKEQFANGSLRNIILKRGEDEIAVDLLRFFILGDAANNPYIMDGDIIFVPPNIGSIIISGAVNNEGEIEFTTADKVSDIIDLALGTKPDAWLDEVEIVRFTDNEQTEKIIVNYNKIKTDSKCNDNILLQLDDRIFVRTNPNFHKKTAITVAGEVQFPGVYPIEEGKTTLYDILQICGKPTAKADLHNAFVQKQKGIKELDPEFERLKLMQASNMNKLEYAYFKNSVRELKGKYSVDITSILNGDKTSSSLIVQDGDLIVIPQKSSFVNVAGQVIDPGLVTYVEGKSFKYYIKQAGGYDWNARKMKVRLIRANTGKWTKPDADTVVMEGDTIFIPEKSEFNTWEFTLDALKIVSSIASIFYVLNNIYGLN